MHHIISNFFYSVALLPVFIRSGPVSVSSSAFLGKRRFGPGNARNPAMALLRGGGGREKREKEKGGGKKKKGGKGKKINSVSLYVS